ncbi:MAG: elongator complex protein 3 [Patescibacteria group bacterium]
MEREKVLHLILSETIASKPQDDDAFMRLNRTIAAKHNLPPQPKNDLRTVYQTMLKNGEISPSVHLNKFLKIRPIRTLSGVTPVTVLTKPFACPGKCIYCPLEPGMPKSYLSNEPGAMRAKANKFDPFMQVYNRLRALYINGHEPDKIELLVLGGTWSAYPRDYREWFIKRCFEGANYFKFKLEKKPIPKKVRSYTLQQAQKINETAHYRIIGITLETRPDWVDENEIRHLRKLGCTRVQLGIQVLDDAILEKIERGHTVEDSIRATSLLRQNGFKIDHHIMQNLPGATPEIDHDTLHRIFDDPGFKPDQVKIYPTIVNKFAPLYHWWKSGVYKPYGHDKLFELLIDLKQIVPYYCRINRVIRDFPETSIQAGNKITNLREMLEKEMKKRGMRCHCIRCREARKIETHNDIQLYIDEFEAAGGKEFFVSYENTDRTILYGFVRVRLNDPKTKVLFPELEGAALTRELHVYGQVVRHDDKENKRVQHKGLGSKLMRHAEDIAKKHGLTKMAVISGIGVRQYYKDRLGYELEGTYMTKDL